MSLRSSARHLGVSLCLVASLVLCACGGGTDTTTNTASGTNTNTDAATGTPATPAADPTGPVVDGRAMTPSPWFDAFPKKATSLKAGDRVIAGVPNGKALNLYVGTLQAVDGDKATVQIGTNAMIERAPSSLLIPLPAGEVKTGDLAAGIQNASAKFEFGLAGEPPEHGKPGQVNLVFSTGLGDVSKMFCDAVFPLVSGTEPLAVVMFEHPGKRLSRGVVIAKADGKVLIKDSAREGMILDESAIKSFSMKQGYKVGDKVQAWSYGIGYKPGTVSAVETPDRTYMVKSVRVVDESEDKFFFTELAPQ